MSENDPNSLLKRILGEEADPLIQMLRQPGADEALLKSRGIDSNAMLERAKAQISRAGKLTEHGINPPIPLEELPMPSLKRSVSRPLKNTWLQAMSMCKG